MQITLIPIRGLPGQPETVVDVDGEMIRVDGIAYDLSPVPEGGLGLPQGDTHPFDGAVARSGGQIACRVRVVLGDSAAPDQPGSPWIVEQTAGDVAIPAARRAQEESQA